MENAESLFDLNPTEEQLMTRDVVQRFAREEMFALAREADEAGSMPAGFLDKTIDLGLNFMPAPESMGGVGGGHSCVSNVLTLEDLARGDMSMAIGATAPLSVINCLLDYGSKEQQQWVIGSLLADSFVAAAFALMEPGISLDPGNLATRAELQADGSYQISGTKSMVAFGPEAQYLIVFADVAGQGTQGFIVETGTTEGLVFSREDYMGLRPLPLYSLSMEAISVPAIARLAGDFDIQGFINLSKLASAALALGCCQAVLDYVVPYVNERVAFGEPVSHRQGVAFMVADMATEIEGLQLMVYRAASQADQGIDCTEAAFLAHRYALNYGMKVGTDGVQLLGGHGFIREHPVEMWYRNLRAIPVLDGMLLA